MTQDITQKSGGAAARVKASQEAAKNGGLTQPGIYSPSPELKEAHVPSQGANSLAERPLVSSQEINIQLPFELGEVSDFKIKVFPERQNAIKLLKKESPSTLAKFAKHFVKAKEEDEDCKEYIIKLPKYYGFTTGEETALADNTGLLRRTFAAFQSLKVSIGERLNVDIQEVVRICSDAIGNSDKLLPEEVDRILELKDIQAQATTDSIMVTAVIQKRLEKTWTDIDTQFLPTPFYNDFIAYCIGEKTEWKPVEEKKQENTSTTATSKEK